MNNDLSPSQIKNKWVLVLALAFVFVAIVITFFSKTQHDSPETISFIDREGNRLFCPRENRESCVRDAERKGFVKLSGAVAGISVDWSAKPLRIVEVSGTAAAAGLRKGDILIELDGNKIDEAFSILRVMSRKQPGDKLRVKVVRSQTPLYFAYDVMRRDKSRSLPTVASGTQSTPSTKAAPNTSASVSARNPEPPAHDPTDCASWNRISVDTAGSNKKGTIIASRIKAALHLTGNAWPPPMNDPNVRTGYTILMISQMDTICRQHPNITLDTAFAQSAANVREKGQALADAKKTSKKSPSSEKDCNDPQVSAEFPVLCRQTPTQLCLDTYYKKGGVNSRRSPMLLPGPVQFLCDIYGRDPDGVIRILKRNTNPIYEEYVTTFGNVTLRHYYQRQIVWNEDDDIFYDRAVIGFVNGLAVEVVSLSRSDSGPSGLGRPIK